MEAQVGGEGVTQYEIACPTCGQTNVKVRDWPVAQGLGKWTFAMVCEGECPTFTVALRFHEGQTLVEVSA